MSLALDRPRSRVTQWGRLLGRALESSAALVLVGFLIRLVGLGRLSYWLDEVTSVLIAQMTPAQIAAYTVDTHPPLYHLALHYWLLLDPTSSMGHAEWWTRLFSALLGALTVPVVYYLGRALFGVRAGLIGAWLLALSPWHIWYSQETRMYAMVGLLAATSWLAGALWLQHGKIPAALAYLVVTVAGSYTEYVMLVIWLGGIFALPLLCRRDPSRRGSLAWLMLQAGVALALIPLVPLLQEHSAVFLAPWFITAHFGPLAAVPAPLALAVLAAVALGGLWVVGTNWTRLPGLQRGAALLLLALLAGSVTGMLVPGATLVKRSLLIFAPFLCLGAGWALTWLNSRRAAWLLVALGCASAAILMFAFIPKEPWRATVPRIEAQWQPGDLALISAPWMTRPFDFYSRAHLPALGIGVADVTTGADLDARLQSHTRVWLILASDEQSDPQRIIPRWLEARYRPMLRWEGYHLSVLLLTR